MAINLLVVRCFGLHAIGDRIADAQEINQILQSENKRNVVRVVAAGNAGTDGEDNVEVKG